MWWLPRFMKKSKGAISLFMAIIMLAMFMLSAVINDGARLRAARTIVQSAADSAALSVLAKYDNALKDKYGLFALEEADKEAVIDDFTNFFVANLSSEYPLSSDYREAIKSFVSKMGVTFTERDTPVDLYDFDLEQSSVDLAYSIIEPSVLQTQMAEFTKYRGFVSMMDIIDLSELTARAEESSEELDKIKETVSGDSGTEGAGYKNDVEAAATKYYELTQRLRALNYANDMCEDCRIKYAEAILDMNMEWLSMVEPDENVGSHVSEIVNKMSSIENKANEIIPELNEYERLKGVLEEKNTALNEAEAALTEARNAKAEAQSASDAANEKAIRLERLENSLGDASWFFKANYCDYCNTADSFWSSEQAFFESLDLDKEQSGYSLEDYAKRRCGEELDVNIRATDDDNAKSTYEDVIKQIRDEINRIGDAHSEADLAKNAEQQAISDEKAAQTAKNNAQAAYNAADNDLKNQREKLKGLKTDWDNRVAGEFESTPLKKGIKEHIQGKGIKEHIQGKDGIDALINKDELEYCGKKGLVKTMPGGIKGGIEEVETAYSEAKTALEAAKTKTRAYIDEVQRRIDEADENADTSMDDALLADAQTACEELCNIEHESEDIYDINGWLDGTGQYADNLTVQLGSVLSTYDNMTNLKNSYVANADDAAYNYLKASVGMAVDYGGSGSSNLKGYVTQCETLKNNFFNSYYDNEYQYEPRKIQFNRSDDDNADNVAGNLFDLFSNFKMDDYRNSKTGNVEKETISTAEIGVLPSTLYKRGEYHTDDLYKAEDLTYIEKIKEEFALGNMEAPEVGNESADIPQSLLSDIGNLEISDSSDSQSQGFDILKGLMDGLKGATNSMTDALLVNFYVMSMFKSRVSKSPGDWKETYEAKGAYSKLSNQTPPYNFDMQRYSDDEKELNLYFREKDSDTFFNSEIEYIISGKPSEKDNENSVYLKIYGIRMVNNLIAIYKDTDLRNLATYASTWAGPFAPLVQIAIIAVLAALETYFDMEFLITYGYKIPFWKTNKNLTLSIDHIFDCIEECTDASNPNIFETLLGTPNCEDSKFLVSYETYLWFFMILTGREDKLLRSADLMQLNIRKTDPDYKLADHYTYVRCHTKATIKPMFVGLGFAPSEFDEHNKRYDVESLNYQGY